VELVTVLPPDPVVGRRSKPRPVPSFTSDSDPVELVNVSAVEAELVAARLRDRGIPAGVLAVGTAGELVAVQFTQGSRVMVSRRDLPAARAEVADLFSAGMVTSVVDDDAVAAQAEAATGWSDPETGAVV
jgi:hypothetical protein